VTVHPGGWAAGVTNDTAFGLEEVTSKVAMLGFDRK